MKVTIVDYGASNLHSVVKALRHAGAETVVTGRAADVAAAGPLVIPGVGAFADGMRGLAERDLVGPIRDHAAAGRPLLGICLGMQLLFSESAEFGRHEGLGLIPGTVVAIAARPERKVPHIGWNRIWPPPGRTWPSDGVLGSLEPGKMVYFAHSFAAVPESEEHRLADTRYGSERLAAAVERGNVLGFQFHPEKSGPAGLEILARWLA